MTGGLPASGTGGVTRSTPKASVRRGITHSHPDQTSNKFPPGATFRSLARNRKDRPPWTDVENACLRLPI